MQSTQVISLSTESKHESKSTEQEIHPLVIQLIEAIHRKLDSEEDITNIKNLMRTIAEHAKTDEAMNIDALYIDDSFIVYRRSKKELKDNKQTALMRAVEILDAYVNKKWKTPRANSPLAVKTLSEIIDELILAKANVNLQQTLEDVTALMVAAEYGLHDIVTKLVNAKANPDIQGTHRRKTATMLAIINGHEKIACYLIETARANIKLKDCQGSTILNFAAEKGMQKIVKICIDSSLNVNSRGEAGKTALISAAQHGHSDVVRMLLAANADANTKQSVRAKGNGPIALQHAAANGHVEAVRLLIAAKTSDAAIRTTLDTTALTDAARFGHRDVVCELLATARVETNTVNLALQEAIRNLQPDDISHAAKWIHKLSEHMKDEILIKDYLDEEKINAYLKLRKLSVVNFLLQHGAIIKYPGDVYEFLLRCDQRDSNVLICLTELCRQHIAFQDAQDYLKKLQKLHDTHKQDYFNKIDEATGLRIARPIINIFLDYVGSPLQNLGLFKPSRINTLLPPEDKKHDHTLSPGA